MWAVCVIGCQRPQPDCSPRIEALPREALVCPACSENARCVGGVCACNTDFVGDGVACESAVRGTPTATRLDGLIMALSADGNTLATLHDDLVSVQRREPSGWSVPVPVLNRFFVGYPPDRTLALNADGSVIAIGYPERATDYCRFPSQTPGNSVFVLSRGEDGYLLEGTLRPAHPQLDQRFGARIALSADGQTLAATSDYALDTEPLLSVFTNTLDGWQLDDAWTARELGLGVATRGFVVTDVALSADGATLAFGANNDDEDAAAQVLVRRESGWQPEFTQVSQHSGAFLLGPTVALDADGSTLAIGLPGADRFRGRVLIHVRSVERGWQQTAELEGDDALFGFGATLTISADGRRLAASAVIGARVLLFGERRGRWLAEQTLGPNASPLTSGGDFLGTSLAFSADGQVLAASAPSDTMGEAVFVYAW